MALEKGPDLDKRKTLGRLVAVGAMTAGGAGVAGFKLTRKVLGEFPKENLADTKADKLKSSEESSKGNEGVKSKQGALAAQIDFLSELKGNNGKFNKVLSGGRGALKELIIDKFGKDPDSVESIYDAELYPARQILGWYQEKERLNKGSFTETTLKQEINLQIVNLGNELIRIKKEALKKKSDKLQQ